MLHHAVKRSSLSPANADAPAAYVAAAGSCPSPGKARRQEKFQRPPVTSRQPPRVLPPTRSRSRARLLLTPLRACAFSRSPPMPRLACSSAAGGPLRIRTENRTPTHELHSPSTVRRHIFACLCLPPPPLISTACSTEPSAKQPRPPDLFHRGERYAKSRPRGAARTRLAPLRWCNGSAGRRVA